LINIPHRWARAIVRVCFIQHLHDGEPGVVKQWRIDLWSYVLTLGELALTRLDFALIFLLFLCRLERCGNRSLRPLAAVGV